MSDLIAASQLSDSKDCPKRALQPVLQRIPTHDAQIGKGVTIHRALPTRARRMIGAWCFFDHFGPMDLSVNGLNVAPHPHIGLQTFTWTLSGDILHRDSIGSKQVIYPGAVNLMTAGNGISHSEESLPNGTLHGVQLWIALPESQRHMQSEFNHYANMPTYEQNGLRMTLLVGELFNMRAPTKVYTPLFCLDINALQEANTTLPLNPAFEYGVMVLEGSASIEEETIEPGTLLYMGCNRQTVSLTLNQGARLFIIGGEPFEEEIFVWWNFVGRNRDEIAKARSDWESGDRFGEVKGYIGNRLEAPPITWK